MYKKILVPLDGSELAEAAVPLAIAISKAAVARLCLVHVRDSGPIGRAQMPAPDKYLDQLADGASNDLHESVDTAVIHPDDDAHVSKKNAALHIAKYAKEHGYDLIVTSTAGRGGLKRVVLGSVAEALLRVTPCPVLFCRPQPGVRMFRPGPHPIKKVLIALDQTEPSESILDEAVAFAKKLNSAVVLVHVVQTLRAHATVTGMEISEFSADEWEGLNAQADAYLAGVKQQLASAGVTSTSEKLMANDVAAAILETAARLEADAIALASRAPQGLARAVLGSVADRLVRTASCPVLVIRARS